MLKDISRRLLGMLETLVLASIVCFAVLRVLPGDPARLIVGPLAGDSALKAVREQLGIDKPIYVQYVDYVRGFVAGEWGYSYSNGATVSAVLGSRLPATIELATYAFIFALVFAIIVATLATYYKGFARAFAKGVSLVGLGTPPFWLALILLLVFSIGLGVLPGPSGRLSSFLQPPAQITGFYTVDALLTGNFVVFSDAFAHLIAPAISLAVVPWAFLTRLLTANIVDSASAPYSIVVRSKGVSSWKTHTRHVLHNSLLPTISSSGVIFATLITGSVLIEQMFDWPGIGQVLVEGIQRQDFAVVQTFILLSAVIYVVANLVVDLVAEFADPRLRLQNARN